jgi:hypothetical protein
MQDVASPLSIVPAKTDKEYAAELKKRMIEAHKDILEIMNEAHENDFIVNVAIGMDGLGKITIQHLIISKIYK